MVVWLASYPRSGNTLFRILLHYVFGFQTYSVYPGPNIEALTPEQIRKLVELLGEPDQEYDLKLLQADSRKHFVKTHDLPRDDTFPAIVLVRDGRDAVVSYAHFVLKTEHGVEMPARGRLFEKTLEELIVGEQFGGWSGNVSAWIEQAGWASVVRYEDLIEDPISAVGATLARLGLDGESNGATPPSFEELHAFSPWFFRRGKPGCWREEMPKHLEDLFLERHGDTLAQILGHDEPRDLAGQFGSRSPARSGLRHLKSLTGDHNESGAARQRGVDSHE